MTRAGDFREIGHSGGKYTLTVETDDQGRRGFSLGVSSSSPTPHSIITVQVTFDGVVIGISQLEWRPDLADEGPAQAESFPVFIASDREGLFGHQCRRCGSYWRSESFPFRWRTTCPNCGLKRPSHEFLTQGHLAFIGEVLKRVLESQDQDEDGEYVIDMDAIADEVQKGKKAPDFYYAETAQQSQFRCSVCRSSNDILGKYGYCSCCGYRNNHQLLENDLQSEVGELKGASGPERAVKLLVSAFDSCCKDYVQAIERRSPMTPGRRQALRRLLFHDFGKFPDVVRSYFDIRLLKDLRPDDKTFLNMMFQRRHVYEHRGGVADQHYVERSGDPSIRLGMAIRENVENVHRLKELLVKMTENFDEGFHSIFPPDETAVRMMGDHSKRHGA